MRILIATNHVPFLYGGAEMHAESLCRELRQRGHEAEITMIPFKWYPPEKIIDHLMACRLLDVSESCGVKIDRVIGLKFPAYHIPHEDKVIWALHQYRGAFDQWGGEVCDLGHFPNGRNLREGIVQVEKNLLPEARHLFANSGNVARRMKDFCGLEAEPLYHPPQNADLFHCKAAEPFLFYPSRLCAMKRQSLVLEALEHTRQPVKVVFAGAPEDPQFEQDLKARTQAKGLTDRVTWLGRISDEEKRDNFARCLGVIYPPIDEDYGYVTLEAMLASKPILTCSDSGGPLEFVENRREGLVTDPTPSALAEALDTLWSEQSWAREAGILARARYQSLEISWDTVVNRLLRP
jgi:glycosyltransferase involved in cell wall biosynthesis